MMKVDKCLFIFIKIKKMYIGQKLINQIKYILLEKIQMDIGIHIIDIIIKMVIFLIKEILIGKNIKIINIVHRFNKYKE